MVVAALLWGYGLVMIDHAVEHEDWHLKWFLYGGNPEGARSVLSTIAASMVTIAGVIFSITLVALTMASSQFGPRLLRNFISDRSNKLVLGTFISTFVYSLVVLLSIRGETDAAFVPKLSVTFAFIMALASLGVLIFFIHHVSSSIQADNVIKNAYSEFSKSLKTFMVEKYDNKGEEEEINVRAIVKDLEESNNIKIVHSHTSGYIQYIEYERMCEWAAKKNVVAELLFRTGDFVMAHQRLAKIYFKDNLPDEFEEKINEFVVINTQRTSEQEIEYSINQIVEVGVRALSPSLNDPHTAITSINWLGVIILDISRRRFPSLILKDQQEDIKIIKKENSYKKIIHSAFDQLRLYAKDNIFVLMHLLAVLEKLLIEIDRKIIRESIQNLAEIIVDDIHKKVKNERELAEVDIIYRDIMEAYER